MRRVLVVDDEENIRLVLRTLLRKHGYEVEVAESGEAALALVDSFGPDVILTDVRMPKMGGLDLLATLKAKQQPATVIVMSAYGSNDLALEAMKAGAYDYLSKPFKPDEVVLVLRKAEEREALRRENLALKEQIREGNQYESILAKSPQMVDIFRTITKVADFKATVLISGESGVGKELVARALHSRSSRKGAAFVAVNCGAIPENLLESELFGHKKGAFTDATSDRRGLFEEANGGTLFLDEIGELPLNLQVKLLRVLQEENIRRVGDSKDMKVDVRIVAATHRDLGAEAKAGRFREDLYYRLNVVNLFLPPLRERGDDVLIIAKALLSKFADELHSQVQGFTPQALAAIKKSAWPGNIRQLENRLKKALVLCERKLLDVDDLELGAASEAPILPLEKAKEEFQRRYVLEVLERNNGNRTQTARDLGVDPRTIFRYLEREANPIPAGGHTPGSGPGGGGGTGGGEK